jgi:hypothetical protein
MKKETLNGVIAGALILTLGLVAYLVFNKKGKGVPNPNPNPNPDPFDLNGGGGVSNLNFRAIADSLFDAMDGYGTGENTIEKELKKLKTKADWNALVEAYGTRTLNCGTGNPFCSDFTGDLADCLNDELDEDELEDVNEILNKIGVSI